MGVFTIRRMGLIWSRIRSYLFWGGILRIHPKINTNLFCCFWISAQKRSTKSWNVAGRCSIERKNMNHHWSLHKAVKPFLMDWVVSSPFRPFSPNLFLPPKVFFEITYIYIRIIITIIIIRPEKMPKSISSKVLHDHLCIYIYIVNLYQIYHIYLWSIILHHYTVRFRHNNGIDESMWKTTLGWGDHGAGQCADHGGAAPDLFPSLFKGISWDFMGFSRI